MLKPTILHLSGYTSQYDVITHYSNTYLKAFEKKGYVLCDIQKESFFAVQHPHSFVFIVGGIGQQWSALFDVLPLKIPIVNILTDHPYYYFPLGKTRITHLPVSLSPDVVNFFERFYRDTDTSPISSLLLNNVGFKDTTRETPILQKKNAILLAGTIEFPDELLKNFCLSYPFLKDVALQLIAFLTENENIIIDILLEQVVVANTEKLNKITHLSHFKLLFHFLDKYSRNFYRIKTLKALANSNIPVIIISNQSEKIKCLLANPANFMFRPSVNFQEFIKIANDVKFVLANTYQNGTAAFSERIPSAMLNGTIPIYGQSDYINTLVEDGKEGISFSWKESEELPYKLQRILRDDSLLESMSISAQSRAFDYTVDNTAEKLLNQIPAFRQLLSNFV